MRHGLRVLVLAALIGTAAPAMAQVGWLLGGEVRVGAAWVDPRGAESGLSLDSSTALSLDYTHFFGRHFALNLNYLYTDLGVEVSPAGLPGPSYKVTYPTQSFNVGLELHIQASRWLEPYVGAGANVLYTSGGGGRPIEVGGGGSVFVTSPSGGVNSATFGGMLEAGLNVKLGGPFHLNLNARYADNGIRMDRYVVYGTGAGSYVAREGTYTLKVNPVVLSAGIAFRW